MNIFNAQLIKNFDWQLFGAVMLLFLFGILTIYSIGDADFFQKQLLWMVISLIVFFLVSFLDYRIFKNYSFVNIILYIVIVVFLVFLLIVNLKVRGAASWIQVLGLNFQPAEFAKIILALLLAKYFSVRHIEMYQMHHIIVSGIYAGIPMLLIFMQPDIGSAAVIFSLWLGIIIISGIRPYHFSLLFVGGILTSIGSWLFVLKEYQKARILFYISPETDPLGHGYNLIQSLSSIGSAGFWGKGLGHGSQGRLGFLPEAHTDFIFAAFAEEWGSVGVLLLFLVLGFIFYRMIKIVIGSTNNFARLCVIGIALMIFSQTVINIGMNIGLFPITGITLPFMSYGGSSLLVSFIALGFIESIKMRS